MKSPKIMQKVCVYKISRLYHHFLPSLRVPLGLRKTRAWIIFYERFTGTEVLHLSARQYHLENKGRIQTCQTSWLPPPARKHIREKKSDDNCAKCDITRQTFGVRVAHFLCTSRRRRDAEKRSRIRRRRQTITFSASHYRRSEYRGTVCHAWIQL